MGLPLAVRAAEVGIQVTGFDVDTEKVKLLIEGNSYIEDVSSSRLESVLAKRTYSATSKPSDLFEFDIAVITVPTPLDKGLPVLTHVEDSADLLARYLRPGALVILESTTYPGTTEELLVPRLEALSGLTASIDFFVGYSPERIDPGNAVWNFVNTPKVISGVGSEALSRVRTFYSRLVEETVSVSSPKEAELTKLLENTFRHVNIALVNELAIFGHQLGVNIWESINAAATKPFGFMKFSPGPGVGGHCLPIDPSYLSWKVKTDLGENFRFVELANEINRKMPSYVALRASQELNTIGKAVNGSKILILGLSYKANSSDARESPAWPLIKELQSGGAIISALDNHIPQSKWPKGLIRVHDTVAHRPDAFDFGILVTEHDDIDYEALVELGLPILDTRNRLSGTNVIHL